MNVRIETLSVDEVRRRHPFVPAWMESVLVRAREAGRMVEYESTPTPFGTYPIRVRVADAEEARS